MSVLFVFVLWGGFMGCVFVGILCVGDVCYMKLGGVVSVVA